MGGGGRFVELTGLRILNPETGAAFTMTLVGGGGGRFVETGLRIMNPETGAAFTMTLPWEVEGGEGDEGRGR